MSYYVDDTLQTINRLFLTMKEYEEQYPFFLKEYLKRTDALEYDFLSYELQVFEDIFKHLQRIQDLDFDPVEEFEFDLTYKRYNNEITNVVLLERSYHSTERKIAFLYNKRKDSDPYTYDPLGLEPAATSKAIRPYTNNQLALIYHYFFKSSFMPNAIDKSRIARLIHLASGQPLTNISNSEFYKKLKKAPGGDSKANLDDLRLVKAKFIEFGVPEIAKIVEMDINSHNE